MRKFLSIAAREVSEALPAFVFFLVAFHMIVFTRAATLEEHQLGWSDSTVATVSALIVAKAILLVEKLPFARMFGHRAIYSVVWKALIFGVVALAFRALEEVVRAAIKGGGPEADVAGGVDWPQFWVIHMWLFALLFLYCLAARLVQAIGRREVMRILFQRAPQEAPPA